MSDSPVHRYPGKEADVTWDWRLCIHVGECTRTFGDLMRWVPPSLLKDDRGKKKALPALAAELRPERDRLVLITKLRSSSARP